MPQLLPAIWICHSRLGSALLVCAAICCWICSTFNCNFVEHGAFNYSHIVAAFDGPNRSFRNYFEHALFV